MPSASPCQNLVHSRFSLGNLRNICFSVSVALPFLVIRLQLPLSGSDDFLLPLEGSILWIDVLLSFLQLSALLWLP